ncbi:hypothetical protein [Nonomuraea sp. NPDC005501]|uniref:hypothetical protein n=1 Tax=Nonomuraea sp. NPDC005501 TaxID=3156884 RepID=UPI0033B54384
MWPIRLLVDHREALVAERTRLINRVLWLVHDLNPDMAAAVTKLKQVTTRRNLTAQLQALPATAARRVALAQIALIDSLSIEIDAATGSTWAATGNSTPPCTASPSPKLAATKAPARCSNDARKPPETPPRAASAF